MGADLAKKNPAFELVEGSKWKLQLKFKCYGKEILAGLQFHVVVGKGIFKVAETLVVGSFAPNGQETTYVYPRYDWNEAPSGMIKRGKYHMQFKIFDADKKEHVFVKCDFNVTKKKMISLCLRKAIQF